MIALSFRTILGKAGAVLAMLLLVPGPVYFLIFEKVGGTVWGISALAGIVVAVLTYDRWWPELREYGRPVLCCLALLLLYLMLPVMSYLLVDGSDFALSRVTRQLLFLGTPMLLLLLWWLRPGLLAVLAVIAANAVFFGIYACWYAESFSGRVQGVVHAVHFGNISLFLGFASLALLPLSRGYGWRILAVLGVVLGGAASILAGARGGWLALPVLLTVTLIMLIRSYRLRHGMIFGMLGLIGLLLIGLWHTGSVQRRVHRVERDIEQLSQDQWLNSMGTRILMWEQAWLEIREAPLKGTGFSGYRDRVQAAVESGALPGKMLDYASEPHNEYLYQWMTRGLAGIVFFLLCLAGAVWRFLRWLVRGDPSRLAIAQVGLSLVTMIAIGGMTITVIDQRAVIRFLGWILALLLYCIWLNGKERKAAQTPRAAEARVTACIPQRQARP
ncbi:MAG TPA: O-antigen ligase family protein [Gammaproteobacteria bacterium]|nr:O-antigen ligase family protein [Gammaproteobacteria bacterium]